MKYPIAFLALLTLALTACGKSHYSNCTDSFNTFEQGPLKQLVVGQTTREGVVAIMGAPDGHTTADYAVYEQGGADRKSSNYCGVISMAYTDAADGNAAHDLFSQAIERRVFDK